MEIWPNLVINGVISKKELGKIQCWRLLYRPYLDNFLTNPIHILAYSGDSGSESPEYAKIYMGLVTKLSRYRQIQTLKHQKQWEQIMDISEKEEENVLLKEIQEAKSGHISITLLPTPTIFCDIRAIQTPNRPNIPKNHSTW